MKEYNQLITDIAIVCVIPVMIVLGYRFFIVEEGDFSADLLSAVSGVATPGDTSTLGAKSKEILTQLNSISFDKSIFATDEYKSLKDFTPPYYATATGREYPFDTPPEVRAMLLRNTSSETKSSTTSTPASASKKSTTSR